MPDPQPQDCRSVPLADFIEQAASRTPTPGGGSIAAAAGAMGASMVAMAVNFTRGSDKFKDVAAAMDEAADELTRARSMFLELMAEDMAAFAQWQAAWRMDKADPGRPAALELATATAIAVPREMASLCLALLDKAASLVERINPRLLSDVGVGSVLLESAMRAAHYNVRVNLGSLTKQPDRDQLSAELARQRVRGAELLAEIEAKLATKF